MNQDEKKKLQKELEEGVWKLINQCGHVGDTYHWTIEMQLEPEKDLADLESFEGGCNY